MGPSDPGRLVDVRHSLPRRSPVLPIVIGIVLAVVAGVGAVRAVWVSVHLLRGRRPVGAWPAAAPTGPSPRRPALRRQAAERAAGAARHVDRQVENIDWPSAPGLSEAELKAEYCGWLDLAGQRNLNAVFVQVRPHADALWPSS